MVERALAVMKTFEDALAKVLESSELKKEWDALEEEQPN